MSTFFVEFKSILVNASMYLTIMLTLSFYISTQYDCELMLVNETRAITLV